MNGLFNEMTYFNGVPETVPDILKHIDDLGGPNSYPHYAAGWAVAGDTPFTWTKQVAGSYGGTRNGLVDPLAQGHRGQGRSALAVASRHRHRPDDPRSGRTCPSRRSVNGTPQTPIEGVSMLYTFADAKAKDRHKTQYFEIFGNRGIYHDGWLAHTVHRAAWEMTAAAAVPRRQVGALPRRRGLQLGERSGREESRKAQGVAGAFPRRKRSRTMRCPWMIASSNVLNAALVGRPDLMAGRTSLTVYEGMIGMTENVFINTKNRVAHHHRRGADSEGRRQRRDPGPGGPLRRLEPVPQGWQADVHLQLPRPAVRPRSPLPKPLPDGKVTIRYEFAYDGGGLGKGGTGTILVNGEKVAEGRIDTHAGDTSSRPTKARTSASTARRP